ncbi:ABC transporter substrate-binding protein [Hoyosella altamirensis]|uniref:Iron complex transport system substrate-binding protein n=1 Tax=Hoyosella altamirensis TaxID=616997 RepID=A0A839RNI2_9ACTN|nr:ABC transporter substrate-binding protein [Hoyosella altamirensis]MBB3037937.1 iron complex transport system substrate-binding protein [Hoyosella altamirensis]
MRGTKLSGARRAGALAAASLLALGLAACGNDGDGTSATADSADVAATSDSTRTFEAQNGSIEIPAEPQSIVACGYAVLPLIQAQANLSAVCEWTREIDSMAEETRAAYDALPKIAPDGAAQSINYEAVAAAEPDLIIMGVPIRAKESLNMEALEALAPVVFLGPTTASDWRELGEQQTDAAGVAQNYGPFKETYDARATEIAEKYKDSLGSLKFAGVCDICGANAGEFVREYADSYTTNLFADLGADFPGQPDDDSIEHAEYASYERIPELLGDADVIVYAVQEDGTVTEELEELMNSDLWQSLPAVQSGNLIPVRHGHAATYQTAVLALDSIEESLETLPAANN